MQMYEPQQPENQSIGTVSVGRYTAKVFGWMFFGLLVTFATAALLYATKAVLFLFTSTAVVAGVAIAELVVVLVLTARLHKLSVPAARVLFLFYAVLNGVFFSTYCLAFELPSLVLVFAMTAVYFGVMAAVGYFTSVDLSRLRSILTGGLIAMLIFWVLSMFLDLSAFERMACFIGVALFLAFTAYDTQKIRAYHQAYAGDEVALKKAAIFSALQLYLDFINLFIYMLRILGKRR